MAKLDIPIKQVVSLLGMAGAIAAFFIYPHEGTVHTAYRDSGGVWSICKGHTRGVYEGQVATDADCDRWYLEDVAEARAGYHRLVRPEYHPNVEAACIDFIFNAGSGNFSKSMLRKKLNARAPRESICGEFPKWDKVAGKDCHLKTSNCGGIVARRQNEKELCLSDELVICDHDSGRCQPIGVRAP